KKDIQDWSDKRQQYFHEEMDELDSRIKESPELARAIAASSAVKDWQKGLLNILRPYSIDLTEAMVLPNRRPVVFLANLEDISSDGGRYFVRFRRSDYALPAKMRFILECDAQQLQQLR